MRDRTEHVRSLDAQVEALLSELSSLEAKRADALGADDFDAAKAVAEHDADAYRMLRARVAQLEARSAEIQGTELSLETWEQELEHGTAMVRVAPIATEADSASELVQDELVYRPPSYFVGRKIVTADELNGVVKGYYRWAEASLNLIIPVFALSIAIYLRWQSYGIPLAVLSIGLIYVLLRSARRRHQEYKDRVRDFIEGRLRAVQEESKQKAKAKTLSEVVAAGNELLKKYKKASG